MLCYAFLKIVKKGAVTKMANNTVLWFFAHTKFEAWRQKTSLKVRFLVEEQADFLRVNWAISQQLATRCSSPQLIC